ncbi:MAG: PAS domain-containing protein [Pseudomonadota bacterium]
MHHRGTLELFHYWTQQRAGRRAPKRADISPAGISAVLGNTFILEGNGVNACFRLAGTRLCNAFGRELRGTPLPDLFAPRDRLLLSKSILAVCGGKNIIVGETVAEAAEDKQISIELLLMPLADESARMLGSLQFLQSPYWLGSAPLGNMKLVALKHADPDQELVSLANRPPVMLPTHGSDALRPRMWHIVEGGRSSKAEQTAPASHLSVISGGKAD